MERKINLFKNQMYNHDDSIPSLLEERTEYLNPIEYLNSFNYAKMVTKLGWNHRNILFKLFGCEFDINYPPPRFLNDKIIMYLPRRFDIVPAFILDLSFCRLKDWCENHDIEFIVIEQKPDIVSSEERHGEENLSL